jgi:hypothetical protein
MKTHGFVFLFAGLIVMISLNLTAMGWKLPFEANDSTEVNIVKYALNAIVDNRETHIANIFAGPALLQYGNNDDFLKLNTDLSLRLPLNFDQIKISTTPLTYSGPGYLNEPSSMARTFQLFQVSGWNRQNLRALITGKIECASYWTTSGLVMNQVIQEHTYCRIFEFQVQQAN